MEIISTTQENSDKGIEIKNKVAQLEKALLEDHPSIPVLLRTIHTQIRNVPELCTLLSEEEICTIVAKGLARQVGVDIAQFSVKKPSNKAAKESMKNLTIDDL